MWDSGVGSWIERRARTSPDHIALVAGDRSFSYAELAGRIRRLANGLQQLGVRRGDRVAWLGPNHPAFLESMFAAGLLGAALAPVNHRLAAGDVEALLADAEPTVLIHHGVRRADRRIAGPPEILAYGRERLPPHQAPTSVTFVDRLPRNSVGKLIRAQLR